MQARTQRNLRFLAKAQVASVGLNRGYGFLWEGKVYLTSFKLRLMCLFVIGSSSISVVRAQCAQAECDDGWCQPECGECQTCNECLSPMGEQLCGANGMPGNDAGMGQGNEQDLGVLDEADAGQDAALRLDANPPDDCGEQRCGDGVCVPECGECEACQDCAEADLACGRNGDFNFNDCVDGAYYERLGFPEVSVGGGNCSRPDCPTFEAFCAVPEHRGVGVTGCQAMPGGQPGSCFGTPMQCDCGDGELECRERDEMPDECQTDCDCVGSPNGGRCRDDALCGNICDLRCLNRRPIQYDNSAFSSCEFPCPTARRPGPDNPGRVFLSDLPSHCSGGPDTCDNPNATPIAGPNTPQSADDSCGFYLRVRECLTDCGSCEKNRLEGYYAICSNMRTLSNGERPRGLPAEYFTCGQDPSFRAYADGMMFCLQAKASAYMSEGCRSCNTIVSGMPDFDIESGIIGAHTECNDVNGFCNLARVPGGAPLRCFGAGLGRAWGSVLGHHSPIGALQPVGICHLMSQLLACADGDPQNLVGWQSQICEGYVDGCMSQPSLAEMFPDADIPGLDTTVREVMQRAFCTATCPQFPLVALAGFLDIGTDGALEFERECNALLTQGISIFGFPVIPGLGEIGLPGTGSGRDPCLSY